MKHNIVSTFVAFILLVYATSGCAADSEKYDWVINIPVTSSDVKVDNEEKMKEVFMTNSQGHEWSEVLRKGIGYVGDVRVAVFAGNSPATE